MSEVKGSSQYRSVVVRYRPWQPIVLLVLIVALLLLVAALSVWWGRTDTRTNIATLIEQRDHYLTQWQSVRHQRDDLEQQLANLSVGAKVDRESVNSVRLLLKDSEQTIADLTEEISFYKGLMSPSELDKGLSIRGLELTPIPDSKRIHFKLVLQQTALKHGLLKGSVSVTLVGVETDEQGKVVERRYPLAELSDDISKNTIALRFKYFQNIEGDLLLPENFNVQKVALIAKAVTPKKVVVEELINWSLR